MDAPLEPEREPVVIGVLGGIAAGKSAVARLLAGERGVVLDADALARAELESAKVRFHLLTELGSAGFTEAGAVDRQAVAERAFSSPEFRSRLEGWIHPGVRGRIRAGLEEARANGRTPVVLDVPLLLENDREHGLARRCDFLVFVAADAELRDRRAVERRSWSPGEVARREQTQLPLAQKESMARYVIPNETGLEELEARVREIRRAERLDRPRG